MTATRLAAIPYLADEAIAGERHETPWEREPDDCRCNAWSSSECGCGKYGTGRLVTPNPYRAPLPTPDALQATGDARSPRDALGDTPARDRAATGDGGRR